MNENDILGATGDELTGYGVAAIIIFFIFIGLGLAGAYYAQVWIMMTGATFWLMGLLLIHFSSGCWWVTNGDLKLVTIFGYGWQNFDVSNIFWMLVSNANVKR